MLYYQVHIDEALAELQSSQKGLTKKQTLQRLQKYGPNAIRVRGEPLWRKIIEPFANVFIAVLIVAAIISVWQREPLDAAIIISIIAVSAAIYYVQRFSTERILRALQKKVLQDVEVIRDGRTVEVSTEDLVPGDIVLLGEGQKVPADSRLIHAVNVRADEAMLTGESVPVSKQAHPLEGKKEIYEQSNMLFQGSFIVSGEVKAVVVSTGNETEFGRLAALSAPTSVNSPVQKKIDKLIAQIVVVVLSSAVVIFGLALFRGMEVAEALRFGLALAVAAVPEGLPVAITVVLVLGMRRMAKKKALVRSMRAIESIGVITTIATDKTGTLTKNKLSVQKVWWPDFQKEGASLLAGTTRLAVNSNGDAKMHDPLDGAMHDFARQRKAIKPKALKLEATIPFEHRFAMSGNIWQRSDGYELSIKGAPEQVIADSKLKKADKEAIQHELHTLTGEGYRVIALARAELDKPIESFDGLPKNSLEFVGFLAVADELRPEAKRAVRAAQEAGVTVRMVTGDHFETAYSIGKQLDMVYHRNQVFDSREMTGMNERKLSSVIKRVRVFSRVIPENKFRILQSLKKQDITAMTGDGVNDVPALANAHVGVAMGGGSQIAKEASDIVLLDNNFKSIITAMHEGRVIFSNIQRMLYYLLSTNAGQVLTMFGALFIGLPLPVVAVQILWINLVTDTIMVIPLGLEPGEKHIMKSKPRRPKAPILGKLIISRMVVVSASMAIATLAIFYFFVQSYSVDYARTIAFSSLVVMQWANAFNARSELQSIVTRLRVVNVKFYVGLALAVAVQMIALFGPLKEALHLVPVATSHLVITGLISIVVVIVTSEAHKLFSRRFRAAQARKLEAQPKPAAEAA